MLIDSSDKRHIVVQYLLGRQHERNLNCCAFVPPHAIIINKIVVIAEEPRGCFRFRAAAIGLNVVSLNEMKVHFSETSSFDMMIGRS